MEEVESVSVVEEQTEGAERVGVPEEVVVSAGAPMVGDHFVYNFVLTSELSMPPRLNLLPFPNSFLLAGLTPCM